MTYCSNDSGWRMYTLLCIWPAGSSSNSVWNSATRFWDRRNNKLRPKSWYLYADSGNWFLQYKTINHICKRKTCSPYLHQLNSSTGGDLHIFKCMFRANPSIYAWLMSYAHDLQNMILMLLKLCKTWRKRLETCNPYHNTHKHASSLIKDSPSYLTNYVVLISSLSTECT